MEKKRSFLLLMSVNTANAQLAKAYLARLKAEVDEHAAPLWVDGHGVGIFISSELPAWRIRDLAFPDVAREQQMLVKELLVLEVGPDWEAERNSKAAAWLNSRYPKRT